MARWTARILGIIVALLAVVGFLSKANTWQVSRMST